MSRRAHLGSTACLLASLVCLTSATQLKPITPVVSSSADQWQRLWKRNPADFEGRVSRSLHQALDRLLHQGQRWRWWRRDRDHPRPQGWSQKGDALQLILQVWRRRNDPTFVLGMCEELTAVVHDERAVDELESYLPQLAHMILTLPADSLLSSVLERFVLRVCEANVHWALQLRWIVCVLPSMESSHSLLLLPTAPPMIGTPRSTRTDQSSAVRALRAGWEQRRTLVQLGC